LDVEVPVMEAGGGRTVVEFTMVGGIVAIAPTPVRVTAGVICGCEVTFLARV